MPLSEHEQRVIEELEQVLYDDDPDFAHRVSARHPAVVARRRFGLSAIGAVSGLVLLLSFCWTTVVVVGVLGYLVMLTSFDTLWATVRGMRRSGASVRRSWIACTAVETRARLRDWVWRHR